MPLVEVPQINLIDFDVYGRSSNTGGALIHKDDFAISNAIIFFLTSAKGDYLYSPNKGGVLSQLLFKQLDESYASFYGNQISDALRLEFGALITNISCQIKTNFDKRYYEVNVYFTSIQTNVVNQAQFFTKPLVKETAMVVYIDINLADDNLLAFVLLQKTYPDQARFRLELNNEDGKWYWGRFRFNNFDENSSNFEDIFEAING